MNTMEAFKIHAGDYGNMIIYKLDGIGPYYMAEGWYEKTETKVAIDFLKKEPGTTVIDLGANIGSFAIAVAKQLDGMGQVIAVEPQERLFYALAGNIALNNLFNARAIWAAASDAVGSILVPNLDFQSPGRHEAMSLVNGVKQGYTVPTVTVDSLNLSRLDLLKIDIEGMEPKALDGAKTTIERCRPIIIAENKFCGSQAIIDRLPGYICEDWYDGNTLARPK